MTPRKSTPLPTHLPTYQWTCSCTTCSRSQRDWRSDTVSQISDATMSEEEDAWTLNGIKYEDENEWISSSQAEYSVPGSSSPAPQSEDEAYEASEGTQASWKESSENPSEEIPYNGKSEKADDDYEPTIQSEETDSFARTSQSQESLAEDFEEDASDALRNYRRSTRRKLITKLSPSPAHTRRGGLYHELNAVERNKPLVDLTPKSMDADVPLVILETSSIEYVLSQPAAFSSHVVADKYAVQPASARVRLDYLTFPQHSIDTVIQMMAGQFVDLSDIDDLVGATEVAFELNCPAILAILCGHLTGYYPATLYEFDDQRALSTHLDVSRLAHRVYRVAKQSPILRILRRPAILVMLPRGLVNAIRETNRPHGVQGKDLEILRLGQTLRGESQKILEDKECRGCARKWKGRMGMPLAMGLGRSMWEDDPIRGLRWLAKHCKICKDRWMARREALWNALDSGLD